LFIDAECIERGKAYVWGILSEIFIGQTCYEQWSCQITDERKLQMLSLGDLTVRNILFNRCEAALQAALQRAQRAETEATKLAGELKALNTSVNGQLQAKEDAMEDALLKQRAR